MITLIGQSEDSATYRFSHREFSRDATFRRPEEATENPDFGAMAEAEHSQWLQWIQADESSLSSINVAESYVAQHFSPAQLLQMKVWLDSLPSEEVPKLNAVYQWLQNITSQAALGNVEFEEPPHIFMELVAECVVNRQ